MKPVSFTEKYYQENTQILEFTMNAIRKEIEKTDCFMGVNLICSLGGGTGSGLGTRLCEEIKELMQIRVLTQYSYCSCIVPYFPICQARRLCNTTTVHCHWRQWWSTAMPS